MDNNTKKDKERECVKSLKAFEQMWNHTKHEKNRGEGPKAHQPFKGNEKNQRRNREQGPTCMGKETKVTRAVMEALAGTTRRKRRRVVLLVSIF
ncbi:hypothetical protein HKD37_12G034374 [Glycine soja]